MELQQSRQRYSTDSNNQGPIPPKLRKGRRSKTMVLVLVLESKRCNRERLFLPSGVCDFVLLVNSKLDFKEAFQ